MTWIFNFSHHVLKVIRKCVNKDFILKTAQKTLTKRIFDRILYFRKKVNTRIISTVFDWENVAKIENIIDAISKKCFEEFELIMINDLMRYCTHLLTSKITFHEKTEKLMKKFVFKKISRNFDLFLKSQIFEFHEMNSKLFLTKMSMTNFKKILIRTRLKNKSKIRLKISSKIRSKLNHSLRKKKKP